MSITETIDERIARADWEDLRALGINRPAPPHMLRDPALCARFGLTHASALPPLAGRSTLAAVPLAPTDAEAQTSRAERQAQRLASFCRLSLHDQQLLGRLGLSPFAPSPSSGGASLAPAQPALSDFDKGAQAAARLFGRPMPAAVGEVSLRPLEPAPGLNADEYARGAAEAMRLFGKKAAA